MIPFTDASFLSVAAKARGAAAVVTAAPTSTMLSSAKAHLILSRFRPIAPKPACLSSSSNSASCCRLSSTSTDLSSKPAPAYRRPRKRPRNIDANSPCKRSKQLHSTASITTDSNNSNSVDIASTVSSSRPIDLSATAGSLSVYANSPPMKPALLSDDVSLPVNHNRQETIGRVSLLDPYISQSSVLGFPSQSSSSQVLTRSTKLEMSAAPSISPPVRSVSPSVFLNKEKSGFGLYLKDVETTAMAKEGLYKAMTKECLFTAMAKPPVLSKAYHYQETPSSSEAATKESTSPPYFDKNHLERVYGDSSEPVLLLDDQQKKLWFNKAYGKALKSAKERASGRGPYIDPLGHPTPLTSFPLSESPKLNAILWGFLKKLVTQEAEEELPMESFQQTEFSNGELSNELSLRLGKASSSSVSSSSPREETACGSSSGHGVRIVLESVSEVCIKDSEALNGDAVEARLASVSIPVFITECRNRIKWMNAAFQRMLGHPPKSKDDANSYFHTPSSSYDDLKTVIVCSTDKIEKLVPQSACAFSGRINLEWTNGGRRHCMSVPCDVCRLVAAPSVIKGETWLWKLDAAVSLSL